MGNVIKTVDTSCFDKMVEEVNGYIEEENHQAEVLTSSSSFSLVYAAKKYDDWFLDPIVGFIIPGFGDILSSLTCLPAIYVAMFKLHSFRLTVAIMYITVIDILVGLIPFAGDIVDAFYKSNKKACRWIVGYVEQDENVISEINKSAFWGAIVLVLIGFLGYLFYSFVMSVYHWIVNLF